VKIQQKEEIIPLKIMNLVKVIITPKMRLARTIILAMNQEKAAILPKLVKIIIAAALLGILMRQQSKKLIPLPWIQLKHSLPS